jgi:hypothetical protein
MAPKNPWFLITFEEIEEIHKRMRVINDAVPVPARQCTEEIIDIINNVRDRAA